MKNHSGVSFVIPIGLEQNVKQLHQELFNDDSYEASDKVKEIDSDIVYLTDITADNTEAMESTFKGDSLNEERNKIILEYGTYMLSFLSVT